MNSFSLIEMRLKVFFRNREFKSLLFFLIKISFANKVMLF